MQKNNKKDLRQLHEGLVTRILKGEGFSSQAQRRSAFDHAGLNGPLKVLIDKVAMSSYKVTDQDVLDVKASGMTEDQIFELIICAAVGESTKQYEQALKALGEVTNQQNGKPHATRDPQ